MTSPNPFELSLGVLDRDGWTQGSATDDQGHRCAISILHAGAREAREISREQIDHDTINLRNKILWRQFLNANGLIPHYPDHDSAATAIIRWNDDPIRTELDIREAFKKAAEAYELSE